MGWVKRASDAARKARDGIQKWDEDQKAAGRGRLIKELEQASQQWKLPSVLRNYDSGAAAERQFAAEASIFDEHGYDATAQAAEGSHLHAGRILLTGGLSILAGRKGIRSKGKLSVTFQKRAAAAAAPIDLADQLRKLASLRDDGILTEDEFQAQKAQLLR
jgi:hypothetical protein